MDGSGIPQEEKTAKTPPYISFSTLKTFVSDLHDHSMPNRIDRSILTRFSGSAQKQLMPALRFLNLIDASGTPTPELNDMAKAYGTNDWAAALGAVLRKAYAPIFEIDLAAATPSQFSEMFARAFPSTDMVMRKCIAFFLPAAKEAGFAISDRIMKGKKPRAINGARPKVSRRSTAAKATPSVTPPRADPPPPPSPSATTHITAPNSFQLLAMFDPSDMTPEEQAAVWLLIQYAKKKESGRTQN